MLLSWAGALAISGFIILVLELVLPHDRQISDNPDEDRRM